MKVMRGGLKEGFLDFFSFFFRVAIYEIQAITKYLKKYFSQVLTFSFPHVSLHPLN
jgi:hypothetical protein